MDALLPEILGHLIRIGPVVVALVTMAETAVFIGLLIPAEATVLFAAFLAERGTFELSDVLAATVLGAAAGDQIGYWMGRTAGRGAAARRGRIARLWSKHEARAQAMFRRKSLVAVTLARFISFVRTLMPWLAGMSGMSWLRFTIYDLLGVLGWGIASVAAGYIAGRSWEVVAGAFGTLSALAIAALLIGMFVVAWRQQRLGVEASDSGPAGSQRMYRVALTGNIASGKSAVADAWRAAGARIIDADELARRAVEPGTNGLEAVRTRFGDDVIHPDGTLDRAALRRRVFADPAARHDLERILHPEIGHLREHAERELSAAGERIVVHIIPLLFETGLETGFDEVILVDAPPATRLDRLVETRNLDRAEAESMIAAQMPAEAKRAGASLVIENDDTLAALQAKAESAWQGILERAAKCA